MPFRLESSLFRSFKPFADSWAMQGVSQVQKELSEERRGRRMYLSVFQNHRRRISPSATFRVGISVCHSESKLRLPRAEDNAQLFLVHLYLCVFQWLNMSIVLIIFANTLARPFCHPSIVCCEEAALSQLAGISRLFFRAPFPDSSRVYLDSVRVSRLCRSKGAKDHRPSE